MVEFYNKGLMIVGVYLCVTLGKVDVISMSALVKCLGSESKRARHGQGNLYAVWGVL